MSAPAPKRELEGKIASPVSTPKKAKTQARLDWELSFWSDYWPRKAGNEFWIPPPNHDDPLTPASPFGNPNRPFTYAETENIGHFGHTTHAPPPSPLADLEPEAANEVLDRVRVYAHKLPGEWDVPRDRRKWDDRWAVPAFAAAFAAVHRRAPSLVRCGVDQNSPPPSPGYSPTSTSPVSIATDKRAWELPTSRKAVT